MKRLALLLALLALPAAAQQQPGEQLFATHCASAGCHGPKGVGGQGPTLQGRGLSAAAIAEIVTLGRAGTPMPPMKDVLGEENVKLVVAYVQALSAAPATGAAVKPAAVDPQVALGSALFFDTRRAAWCSACHSAGKRGGPVGPDLAGTVLPPGGLAAFNTPARPDAYLPVSVTLTDGRHFTGLTRETRDGVLRLTDLSSAPPVVRSFPPAQLAKVEPLGRPAFDHRTLPYKSAELAAIAAFLRGSGNSK